VAGYDVAIVGGGPGGYTAAIRAAQLGARTAIVEKDRLGGTCVVRGCIPTKAMLQSSEVFASIATRGAELGVVAEGLSFDYPAAKKRQVEIVDSLVKGVETLMKANGVDYLRGHGVLGKGGKVTVDGQEITARDIVVATGSKPSTIPIPGAELTIDSDRILELQEAPRRLAVIGGGVVGMEWGALFASLGTEVTVLEALPQILPMVRPTWSRSTAATSRRWAAASIPGPRSPRWRRARAASPSALTPGPRVAARAWPPTSCCWPPGACPTSRSWASRT